MIKRKIESLKKILIDNTKPTVLGNKLLILATAPCVSKYFQYKSVRDQFQDYDIACINYMLFYSKEEIFKIKPKYFILMDPCLYQEYHAGENEPPIPSYLEIAKILNSIDWDCYIVTNVLADFKINNPHIKYVRLSCFSSGYCKWKLPFYKRNIITTGCYNVIQGAIYFAITFGYKKIAMIGCPCKTLKRVMTLEGLHVVEHKHYYDKESFEYTIPYEKLFEEKESLAMRLSRRGYLSEKCFWDLKKYAEEEQCEVVNYSEDSEMEAFRAGKLNCNI